MIAVFLGTYGLIGGVVGIMRGDAPFAVLGFAVLGIAACLSE